MAHPACLNPVGLILTDVPARIKEDLKTQQCTRDFDVRLRKTCADADDTNVNRCFGLVRRLSWRTIHTSK
jgi:hypothetical protein